jgi:hypothetical protein
MDKITGCFAEIQPGKQLGGGGLFSGRADGRILIECRQLPIPIQQLLELIQFPLNRLVLTELETDVGQCSGVPIGNDCHVATSNASLAPGQDRFSFSD